MGSDVAAVDPWPLHRLVLRTPRLELRPDDDGSARELAALALDGIHDPGRMPFAFPWTDTPAAELPRNVMQHLWSKRAQSRPDDWSLSLVVRCEGRVVGTQDLRATRFAATREVSSGSWLGRAHQGQGIGTEMRTAMLVFAFDHLGAQQARSEAFLDNPESLAISRKLGYVEDGTATATPCGERVVEQRLLLTREQFATHRPDFPSRSQGWNRAFRCWDYKRTRGRFARQRPHPGSVTRLLVAGSSWPCTGSTPEPGEARRTSRRQVREDVVSATEPSELEKPELLTVTTGLFHRAQPRGHSLRSTAVHDH